MFVRESTLIKTELVTSLVTSQRLMKVLMVREVDIEEIDAKEADVRTYLNL